ncbi:hypothetical protein BDN72DRAFT_866044 [Pluteus cervinus]|uniref:Uncharacterized protein n=1 Tax=Pluteus cervinus TaxID=181527 RepID=A0ACD2ZY03_9AGAR|nr:hypothetical protein BDN72DRAFT_866044 [Pluteus cervinus]
MTTQTAATSAIFRLWSMLFGSCLFTAANNKGNPVAVSDNDDNPYNNVVQQSLENNAPLFWPGDASNETTSTSAATDDEHHRVLPNCMWPSSTITPDNDDPGLIPTCSFALLVVSPQRYWAGPTTSTIGTSTMDDERPHALPSCVIHFCAIPLVNVINPYTGRQRRLFHHHHHHHIIHSPSSNDDDDYHHHHSVMTTLPPPPTFSHNDNDNLDVCSPQSTWLLQSWYSSSLLYMTTTITNATAPFHSMPTLSLEDCHLPSRRACPTMIIITTSPHDNNNVTSHRQLWKTRTVSNDKENFMEAPSCQTHRSSRFYHCESGSKDDDGMADAEDIVISY